MDQTYSFNISFRDTNIEPIEGMDSNAFSFHVQYMTLIDEMLHHPQRQCVTYQKYCENLKSKSVTVRSRDSISDSLFDPHPLYSILREKSIELDILLLHHSHYQM